MKIILIFCLSLFLFAQQSFGQDTVSTKNRGELIVYVKNVDSKKTTYTGSLDKKAKEFSLKTKEIKIIRFESGDSFSPDFKNSLKDKSQKKEKTIVTHKNSIGFEPFATLNKGLSVAGEFPVKNKFILHARINIAHSQIPINYIRIKSLNDINRPFIHTGYSLSLSSPLTLSFKPFQPQKNQFHNFWFLLPELTFQNFVEIRFNDEYLDGSNQQEVVDQRTTIAGSLMLSLGRNIIIHDRIKLQASAGMGYIGVIKEYYYQNYPEISRPVWEPREQLLRGFLIGYNSDIIGNLSFSIHYLF